MTLRLEVAPNDHILWVRWSNPFSSAKEVTICDLWEMREGDAVSITNRIEDLPPWFELHPLEVSGYRACLMMEKKLAAGYKPMERTEGPNLWRTMTGDRLVWVRETESLDEYPVQALVEFKANALVFGERLIHTNDLVWFQTFGATLERPPGADSLRRMNLGLDEVRALGSPREIADIGSGWRIGS